MGFVRLLAPVALTGCSLIYNPSDLPNNRDGGIDSPTDIMIDAAVADANPLMLGVTQIAPAELLEGQGTGGSSPAVLVVVGEHIVDGATILVEPDPPNADVMITVASPTVSEDGNSIAALVTANISTLGQGTVPLKVTVVQAPPNQATTAAMPWSLTTLDELTAQGVVAPPDTGKLFSQVAVPANITFDNTGGRRAIVRAVGSISMTGTVDASANNGANTPGPGGCTGGAANTDGQCNGAGKGGSGGGGGAGFAAMGNPGQGGGSAGSATGNVQIASYSAAGADENKSAGGGGGGGLAGGAGGAGAGTIELTAGGDLILMDVMIRSVGANGRGGGLASGGGGGGAGGLVLLRSGGMLTPPASVTVTGGNGGGPAGSSGGSASVGRVRFDAIGAGTVSGAHRGPMVVKPASLIVRDDFMTLMLKGTSGDTFSVVVTRPDGTTDNPTGTISGGNGMANVTLGIGLNKVCSVVAGGNFTQEEAANCISIGFIP